MRIALVAFALFAIIGPAAADDSGCDKFAWSLSRERALLAAGGAHKAQSGTKLADIPAAAVVMQLDPASRAAFSLPPERKPASEASFGGMLYLPAPQEPGIYQVTLSNEAWVDAVQNGHYAHSIGSTGRHDCTGLRKSVRFEISAAPIILQVSGVAAETIAIAIRRAD